MCPHIPFHHPRRRAASPNFYLASQLLIACLVLALISQTEPDCPEFPHIRRAPMLAKAFDTLPVNFHGFKLVKRLGGGCTYGIALALLFTTGKGLSVTHQIFNSTGISEAYLAEPPQSAADLPSQVCLKLATSKLDVYPGAYTEEYAIEHFLYQKKVLREISHPFIVKGYPDILSEVPDSLATELAICTLEHVQGVSACN